MVAGSSPVSLAVVVVAQWVEHRIVVSRVVGSNPISHPRGGDGVKRGARITFAMSQVMLAAQPQRTNESLETI